MALITCSNPTVHYVSGCALLLAYDKDNDGNISKSEAMAAVDDFNAGIIADEEAGYIILCYVDGGDINAVCPRCYMPTTVSVTATSTIPLWMWDEDGIASIPCTRANPVKVGMPFGIAVSEGGENNKTTIVNLHVDTSEPKTIPFNIKLSDPLTPVVLRGTYIGNVIVNGGAGTIHVNLTSFIPECKTVTFNSVPVGANVKID